MSTKKWIFPKSAGMALGFIGILVVSVMLVIDYTNVTVGEVRSWIQADVPLGSTKEQVIEFCEKRNFEQSGNYKPELYYEKTHTISASIKPKLNFLVERGVYITFKFDASNRLKSYEVYEAFTFL